MESTFPRDQEPDAPQMTKSILPKVAMVFSTTSFNCAGLRSSADVGMQRRPDSFSVSLEAVSGRSAFLPTTTASAPCFNCEWGWTSRKAHSRKGSTHDGLSHITAFLIHHPRRKRTPPAKIPGWKTTVESIADVPLNSLDMFLF